MWREGPQSYLAPTTWPAQRCPVTVLLELPPQATALIGVAHAAPRACCVHAGFGAGSQEPIGDRVLRDDVLHPGDVQECQQHPQELRRTGRAGESLLAIWVALSGSPEPPLPQWPQPGPSSAPAGKSQRPSILRLLFPPPSYVTHFLGHSPPPSSPPALPG